MASSKMRLSGLISGMDTDSVIEQLVASRRTKVDNAKKDQTKLSWKQDIWKDLNSKLKSLQSKFVSTMRFTTAYAIKKTSVSDSSVASVITGSGAAESVQSLRVDKLAKTGYMTGGTVTSTAEGGATALSKMSELGFSGSGNIKIKVGSKDAVSVNITENTTVSDVLNELKKQGLNASFDEKNQRFFIGAKTSGESADFTITGSDTEGNGALAKMGLQTKEYYTGLGEEEDESGTKYATKVKGQDAVIYLNDAKFTNSTNVFAINGLTITANRATKEGEEVTLTTSNDTDGIYDKIKGFLKEYNAIINQMDKLYNAESAKGYNPLTDEEKEAMSDSEVEKYETKIKDALLKSDSGLLSLRNMLTGVMSAGIQVGDDTLHLSDFGINTLSYFSSADNEKHAYHIDGDPDDENTSGNSDKLKKLISEDPSKVISFFTQLSQNLYDKMSDASKSVQGYRTFGNFFDDVKMKSDYSSFESKIADLEEKANDYEDKMYSKFAKMEKAMAKLQSKTSSLSALIGGGS